jgi:YfiH family protein
MIPPSLSSSFAWQNTAAGTALVCRPVLAFASHLFTTRQWALGSRSAEEDDEARWSEVAEAIGVKPTALVRGRQVHGRAVIVASSHGDQRSDGDIVITANAALAAAVQAADCVPLLIVDQRSGAVAAAHAGWRGMAARVPAAAVDALSREFGSRPADLLAAIGPSIGACCYEVGSQVRDRFAAAGFSDTQLGRWFLDAPAPSERNHSMPGLPPRRREDHWFLDGWTIVRDQLVSAGVPADQTFGADLCTASHADLLCSYRRDGAAAGRIAGVIASRPQRP